MRTCPQSGVCVQPSLPAFFVKKVSGIYKTVTTHALQGNSKKILFRRIFDKAGERGRDLPTCLQKVAASYASPYQIQSSLV